MTGARRDALHFLDIPLCLLALFPLYIFLISTTIQRTADPTFWDVVFGLLFSCPETATTGYTLVSWLPYHRIHPLRSSPARRHPRGTVIPDGELPVRTEDFHDSPGSLFHLRFSLSYSVLF
jgi:hypothetical protein